MINTRSATSNKVDLIHSEFNNSKDSPFNRAVFFYGKNMQVNDQFELRIEKMSFRGGGLGRHQGMVVFVEFAAPNDLLLVEAIEVKKNHAFAKLIKILEPGPDRRTSPCPHFGVCGGCNWQHLTESSQLAWKNSLVQDELSRKLDIALSLEPICESPKPWRYRNRIQLKKRQAQVGYFKKYSHDLVQIHDCLLAEEALIPLISKLQSTPPQADRTDTESWELSLDANEVPTLNSLDNRDLAFAQVNRFVNSLLIEEVLSWSKETAWSELWDLYSGSGNFSFPLLKSRPKARGIAVELSTAAVLRGRKEAETLGWSPKRLEFFSAKVETYLVRNLPPTNALILVDPPRAGLDRRAALDLARSNSCQLLYVSCDPASLARDAQILTLSPGAQWKLRRVRCFDMFPQTDHVETLAEFVPKD